MIIYEFKDEKLRGVIEDVTEAKKGLSKAKDVMCYIEEMLYDIYKGKYDKEWSDDDKEYDGEEISFRRRRGMNGMANYRHVSQMRGEGRYNY